MTDKRAKKLRSWLAIGGEARLRQSAVGELYEVSGPRRERQTAAGSVTLVPPLLDPRIALTPQQRACGTAYGAYAHDMMSAGGAEWVREYVDGGSSGSSGITERHILRNDIVRVARAALDREDPVIYPLGKARKKAARGPHRPIPRLALVDMACLSQRSMSFIAISFGWVVERHGTMKVPDRQRKRIGEALGESLDVIGEAWHERGLVPPGDLAGLDVE